MAFRVFSLRVKKLEGGPLCWHVPQTCQRPPGVPGSPAEGLGDLRMEGSRDPTWSP